MSVFGVQAASLSVRTAPVFYQACLLGWQGGVGKHSMQPMWYQEESNVIGTHSRPQESNAPETCAVPLDMGNPIVLATPSSRFIEDGTLPVVIATLTDLWL